MPWLNLLRQHKSYVFFVIFALAIGVVAGQFFVIFPFLEIDNKVNLLEVAQLLVTIFIGVWVANNLQSNKTEKELILKQAQNIWDMVKESQLKVNTGRISYIEAASHYKRWNLAYNNMKIILGMCGIIIPEKNWTNIQNTTKKIKDLVTDTPKDRPAGKILPMEVKGGIIYLQQARIDEVDREYDSLKHDLIVLQILINKA